MTILLVGNGLSGLFAAYQLSKKNIHVILAAPQIPERSQSVMAAGGINAALDTMGEGDTPALHGEDTYQSAKYIEPKERIDGLCNAAPDLVRELADMGVMFNRTKDGKILCRGLGGHSKKRTAFAGAATGKQMMTALIARIRKAQAEGIIECRLGLRFLHGFIEDGVCYGGLFLDERSNTVVPIYADVTIMATGGQNRLFGKTTGSTLCDGYATAKLFTQGVTLKNLEFIQYHPTTIETAAKRLLISEAARSEGGRLFYLREDGSRCYFMEEKYGEKGNLMSRDVVSKEMFDTHKDIFLDVSFLGEQQIKERIPEVDHICREYLNIDIAKEPIPVAPSVHFFMGGMAVDEHHETSIKQLYAIGECASAYHGANRLGGNSLLAALYSAKVASEAVAEATCLSLPQKSKEKFEEEWKRCQEDIANREETKSQFPAVYIMEELAKIMKNDLGIVREEASLKNGLESLEFYETVVKKIFFDGTLTPYESISLPFLIVLAKAVIQSALYRKESRGAHNRSDYPEMKEEFQHPTFVSYENGKICVGGEAK